jgi:sugar transferase (PEP-CTERM/EpsH1 system associated)
VSVNVLFICHRVPYPATSGSKIRPFHTIRHLSEQGHRVTVASLARSSEEAAAARGLGAFCERMLVEVIPDGIAWLRTAGALASRRPMSFGYFHSPQLARRVELELRSGGYDLVFVHCSSVADYVSGAHQALRILDYCDMDSQKWREYSAYRPFPLSAGYRLEAVRLERAERRMSAQFDLCTCATAAELATLRELGITTPADWFPNGVDALQFGPAADYDPDLIAFVGRMDYYPNQQAVLMFCNDVLPAVRRKRPAVRFAIVGAAPPRAVRELARLPGVSVTGWVSDVRPHVARAALTVAPLSIARGTQNKILESMAMGVPVVCSEVASRGVDAVPGEHLLAASDPAGYVAAIESILDSPALRAQLGQAARARVLSRHSWSHSLARLDALLAAAFERRCTSRGGRNASATRAPGEVVAAAGSGAASHFR